MEGGPEPEPELEQPAAEVAPEPEIEPAAPSVGERWDVLVGRLMGEYETSSEHAGGSATPMSTINSLDKYCPGLERFLLLRTNVAEERMDQEVYARAVQVRRRSDEGDCFSG